MLDLLQNVNSLTIALIIIYILVQTVRDFLSTKNGNGLPYVTRMLQLLVKWHEPNEDGQQVWKNHGVVEAIEKNTQAIEKLSENLKTFITTTKPGYGD